MTDELRDKFYGTTIDQRIDQTCVELQRDAVGLWQIVSFGREGFNLSSDALPDYVRRHVLALLARGAGPVVAKETGKSGWKLVHYGNDSSETAEAIIKEWLEEGAKSDAGGVWFALPHIYDPPPKRS